MPVDKTIQQRSAPSSKAPVEGVPSPRGVGRPVSRMLRWLQLALVPFVVGDLTVALVAITHGVAVHLAALCLAPTTTFQVAASILSRFPGAAGRRWAAACLVGSLVGYAFLALGVSSAYEVGVLCPLWAMLVALVAAVVLEWRRAFEHPGC